MSFSKEKHLAIEAVTRAANLTSKIQTQFSIKALTKEDKSPVTIADIVAQAIICRHLKQGFPKDAIVAEESSDIWRDEKKIDELQRASDLVRMVFPKTTSESLLADVDYGKRNQSRRFWTIDPIDGTKGFLRGEQYAIALALVIEGEVKLGVLACPNLRLEGRRGIVFCAVRNQGVDFLSLENGKAFYPVGDEENDYRMIESVEAAHCDQVRQEKIAAEIGMTTPSRRMDSQAKYGVLAAKQVSLYLRLPSPEHQGYREKIWDHAAGSLIVEESGGRVTDIFGRNLDFSKGRCLDRNQGVVASQGGIHDKVIAVLNNIKDTETASQQDLRL